MPKPNPYELKPPKTEILTSKEMLDWAVSEIGAVVFDPSSGQPYIEKSKTLLVLMLIAENEAELRAHYYQLDEASATFSRPQEIMDEPYDDVAGNGVKIAKLEGLLRMYERLVREISQHLQKLKS